MRSFCLIAAIAVSASAAPAAAASYLVTSISADLTINRQTFICFVGSPDCATSVVNTTFVTPFEQSGSFFLTITNEGDTQLSQRRGDIAISGIINNTNGVLTGRNLVVDYQSTCRLGLFSGCIEQTGRAATFNVVGGVPEPSTWAMMLFGFGAIGTAMRRRRKPRHLLQPA